MRAPVTAVSALILLLVTGAPLRAAVVLEEHFDSDLPNFTANSDWSASYCADVWRTDLNGGVMAARDDSCNECTCNFLVQSGGGDNCIQSDPMDDHIQTGSKHWQNYVYSVRFRNADDDTMGVVFRYVNSSTFYLFHLSLASAPTPGACDSQFNGARLIRVLPETGGQVLKEVAGYSYTQNVEHAIRITVVGAHIKVEFDKDGDGQFGLAETFFDQDDSPTHVIPSGRVGLYAYNNGVTEADGTPATCSNGGCWFDDVVVDLLPPNNVNCGAIGWEGVCQNGTLKYCDLSGQLQSDPCADNECCKWVASQNYYSCVPATECNACQDACQAGQKGCSVNLTHSTTCGQGDADSYKEPVFTACGAGETCNPATGACAAECLPACEGKSCGDDGCGGSCGSCDAGLTCKDGLCKEPPLAALGEPCNSAGDCASKMCVAGPDGKVCSKGCTGDAGCPGGFVCEEVTVNGVPMMACLPTGECVPDCVGKVCGGNGCEGSCGECDPGFSCTAGACKPEAGATCGGPEDCASGICITFQSGTFCSKPCSTDEGCPAGWVCGPWIDTDTPTVCAPKGTIVAHDLCREVSECIESCPPGSPACASTCFYMGSKEAQALYSTLALCAGSECAEGCGGEEACLELCLVEKCFQAYAGCFPGTTSCVDALECTLACGSASCAQVCFDGAVPAAKKALLLLFDCVTGLCGGDAGGDCFEAAVASACAEPFAGCTEGCTPVCEDAECGTDGCGGSCGDCAAGHLCKGGQCVPDCTPDCDDRECGDDGCGGSCGKCTEPLVCIAGTCAEEGECVPKAAQRCVGDDLYWFDSCDVQGEVAQSCLLGCADDQCVLPPVDGDSTSLEDGLMPSGDLVTFSAETRSSGCGATPDRTSPTPGAAWLVLLAVLLLQRRKHA